MCVCGDGAPSETKVYRKARIRKGSAYLVDPGRLLAVLPRLGRDLDAVLDQFLRLLERFGLRRGVCG